VKGKYLQKIRETRVSEPDWAQTHWKTLVHNYGRARFFPQYKARFEELYLGNPGQMLSDINFRFIEAVCAILGIDSRISWSMDYELVDGKTERLVGLCKSTGAGHYLSGPAAKGYLEEDLFAKEGISVAYMDYSGYPPYTQLHGEFQHGVTVLDLLFNEGPEAPRFMKSF